MGQQARVSRFDKVYDQEATIQFNGLFAAWQLWRHGDGVVLEGPG